MRRRVIFARPVYASLQSLFNNVDEIRHGWPICEFGWHVLTIGKGVGMLINSENHALPDGQSDRVARPESSKGVEPDHQ